MVSDPEESVYDELLDRAIEHLRSQPIPEDPGMAESLQFLPTLHASSQARQNFPSGVIAMVCVVVVLVVVTFGIVIVVSPMGSQMIVEETIQGPTNVENPVIQTAMVDPVGEFSAMENELSDLSATLDRIDTLIARQEFANDTQTLLAANQLSPNSNP